MELKNRKEERKCLQCDKVLEVIEKQKPKSFCDDACRNKYFRIQQNELVRSAKELKSGEFVKIPKSEYEEMQAQLKVLMDKNSEAIDDLMTDVIHYGKAISKTDKNGNITRIDPESKEGFDAMENGRKQADIMPCYLYHEILQKAKGGATEDDVMAMIKRNRKLTPNQASMIRSKIVKN